MARRARLVATGCFRTNSRFPTSMQQKYWDQGRSTALLTTTRPIPFARSACGSGGKPRYASIFPSARSRIDSLAGCLTQLMSLLGSRPTYAVMLARNAYGLGSSAGTATVLPLRSRIVRIRSVPSSSKQPTCSPARMTIGSPASTRRITGAAKCPLISASPEASACSTPTVPAVGVYCTWEKPSARSSSSAIHSGLRQVLGTREILSRVVSGGGSAPANSGPSPARLAVPASVRPRKNSRRLIIASAPSSARPTTTCWAPASFVPGSLEHCVPEGAEPEALGPLGDVARIDLIPRDPQDPDDVSKM